MGRPRSERYLALTCGLSDELKAELYTPKFRARTSQSFALTLLQPWFRGNGEIDVVDRAMMADTANYLPNDLLVKVDIASMAVSLEARAPFLDHHVLEFAASLPARYKLRGLTTKYLLKRALKGQEDGIRRPCRPLVSRRAERISQGDIVGRANSQARLFQRERCSSPRRPTHRRSARLCASIMDARDA
jgi:hypothetical protein